MADIDVGKIAFRFVFDGKDAQAGIQSITNTIGLLKKILLTVVAGKMVKDMANFGKELSLLSVRTGMSIQKLSSLRNVFMSAGSGAKGFEAAIERINKGLWGLYRGEGSLAAVLAPMGISPFGKDEKEILYAVSDWAKNQVDLGRPEGQVMDYLQNVLGLDAAVAERLLKGSSFLRADEARLAEKTGQVSKENAQNLKELHQALGEMNAAWTNMTANIIGFVAPAIIALADGISYLLTFLGENELLGTITAITIGLMGLLGPLKAIAGVLGLFGVKTAIGAGTAAGGAAAGAAGIGAGTIALAGLFIGVIVDSIWECYDMITTGKIRGPIGKLVEALVDVIGDMFKDLADWAGGIWDRMKQYGKEKWEAVKDWYAERRVEFGTAMTFTNLQERIIDENAADKAASLLYRDIAEPVYMTEPFAGDAEDVPQINGGMSIVNNFDGCSFGSDIEESEVAIENAMEDAMSNTVQGM